MSDRSTVVVAFLLSAYLIAVFIILAVMTKEPKPMRIEKNESLWIDKDFDYGLYDECTEEVENGTR